MLDRFRMEQDPEPVPPAAVQANPLVTMRALYRRLARLDSALEEQRAEAAETLVAPLRTLLDLHDHLSETIQRFGVTTSAQEAAIARRTVEFSRLLQEAIARHGVRPIKPVGKPVDAETCVVVGVESNAASAPGAVLREVQVGYFWPHGVLRRAHVIVSGPWATEDEADEPLAADQEPAPS